MTTITALPAPPTRSDPSNFNTRADEFLAALPTFATETNTVAGEVNTNASNASTSAGTATTQAGIATTQAGVATTQAGLASTSAGNAAASESNALTSANNAANYATALIATSTTSLLIATASKTFTTQSGKQFNAGQYIIASSAANPSNFMFGQVTSYSTTTLIVDVQAIGGSGTFADWNISVAGTRGATGTGITSETVGWTATGGTTPKTLTVDTDFTISNAASKVLANTFTDTQTFKGVTDTVFTITDAAGFEINPANGSIQVVTLGAARTPAATNFAAGQCVLLGIDDGTAYTVTWTTVNPAWVKPGGTGAAPTLATTGYTWVLLWKVSSTIYGAEVGKP